MSDLVPVGVLLFGRYAELVGANQLTVMVPLGSTLAKVVAMVRNHPGGDLIPEVPVVACNARLAKADDPVGAGDLVALLPPFAGG